MNIREIRQAYPQYNDLSDQQLADALHQRFYADMPVDEFYQKVGLQPPAAPTTARDIVTALKAGALGGTKALTDVFGADNVASAAIAKKLQEVQTQYTPARQAEMAREEAERQRAAETGSMLEEAKVFGRQVLESPIQTAAGAVASFAPYVPMMGLGPVARLLGLGTRAVAAAETVANAAPKVLGTAQGAGAVKGAIYDAVYQAELKDGTPEAEARAKAEAAQNYVGKNIDQILVGAGVGLLANSSGVERLLTPKGAAHAAPSMLPRVGRVVLEEAPLEGLQGAQQQLASNLALQREGQDVPTMQGVIGAGVQEGLMGALGAAPIAAIRGGPAAATQREEILRKRAEEAQRATQEEQRRQAALEQQRQQPEYLDQIEKQYADLVAKQTELQNATKVKAEGKDPASRRIAEEKRKNAEEALREFRESDEYRNLVDEYVQVQPALAARKREQQRVEDVFGKEATYEPEDMSPAAQAERLQKQIVSLRKQQEKLTPEQKQPFENKIFDIESQIQKIVPTAAEFDAANKQLQARLEEAQKGLTEATTTADLQRYSANIDRLKTATQELSKLKPFIQTVTQQPSLADLRDQVDAAQAKGDIDALQRLTPMLAEAERAPELPFETGDVGTNQLIDEITRGREEAARRRALVEQETAALMRVGTKDVEPLTLQLRQQRLQEARDLIRAATKETGPRLVRGVQKVVQQGGKLNQNTETVRLVRANEQDWANFNKELQDKEFRQGDRAKLKKQLKKQRKNILEKIDDVSSAGPSPALKFLQTELASIDASLADVKRKQALGRQFVTAKPDITTQLQQVSDARVSDLIDRLLPLAVERKAEPTRPLLGVQPSLFDIETQKGIAKGAAATQLPDSERQQVKERAEERRKEAFDELEYLLRTEKPDATTFSAAKQEFIDAAIEETDNRRTLAGGPPLSSEYRSDLQTLLGAVVNDMQRLAIKRTPENAYVYGLDEQGNELYGSVEGYAGVKEVAAKDRLTAAQAKDLQTRLYDLRKIKFKIEANIKDAFDNKYAENERKQLADVNAQIADAQAKNIQIDLPALRKTKDELETAIKKEVEKKYAAAKRKQLASVNAQISETAALLSRHIAGAGTQLTVVKGQTRGSSAELQARALGKPEAAIPVLAEQAENLIAEFAQVKDTEKVLPKAPPRIRGAARVAEAPIIQAQDLLEQAQTLRKAIENLNVSIKKAGRSTKPDAIARLDALKQNRDTFEQQLADVQQRYARLAEIQTPTYRAEEAGTTAEDLFGSLEESRARQNAIEKRLKAMYAQRDKLRAELERRGKIAETAPLQALVDKYSKQTPALAALEDQIEAQELELQQVSGSTSAQYFDFVEQREQDRAVGAAPDTRTLTLPGFERKAGVRPVEAAQLQQARTELVALQNAEGDIRRAIASGDTDPTRFLRQIAQEKTNELNAFLTRSNDPVFKSWPSDVQARYKTRYPEIVVPTAADAEHYDALRKQIAYFSNVIRGKNKKAVETAFQNNLKKQEALRDKISKLEQRQRMYEQQEAVRAGAAPGATEAARLLGGAGYRTVSGKVKLKPKKLESWGVKVVTKKTSETVAPAKIAATANMLQKYQREVAAATAVAEQKTQTLEQQLKRATKNLDNLSNALKQIYSERDAKATEEEISNLLAAGLSPDAQASMRDMTKVYAALKKNVEGNTAADVISRLEQAKEALVLESKQGAFAGQRGSVFDEKERQKKQNTLQTQLNELGETIRLLKTQPKTADPWVAAFNALIKETNAKTLIAAQNVPYAEYALNRVEERIVNFIRQAGANVDAIVAEPDSPSKNLRLATARELLDRATQRLPVNNNAYNADIEKSVTYQREFEKAQEEYQKARLEQLGLLKAYGEDLKKYVGIEAENIQALTPQILEQAKTNKKLAADLAEAEKRLAAARVAEREAAAAPPPPSPIEYTAAERATLKRIREGLGLPGVRYETETTNALVTKTKRELRNTISLKQAELQKAQEANRPEAVANIIDQIKEYEQQYEGVMQLGSRVKTPVGEGAEERIVNVKAPTVVESGTRLPRRRTGPLVREGTQPPSQMLSGTAESREAISKGNRPVQAGAVRLAASDLDITKANAVGLTVLKQQLDAAVGDRKTQLQEAFKNATNGLSDTQIKARIKEGNELINVPGAAAVVAAKEKVRWAEKVRDRVTKALQAAQTPAAKEIAGDLVKEAEERLEAARQKLEYARNAVASGIEPDVTPKKAFEDIIDETLEKGKVARAVEGDVDDLFASGADLYAGVEPSQAVVDLLTDSQVQNAVKQLALDGSTELIRRSAREVMPYVLRTKFATRPNLTHKGKPVPAVYDPATNTMIFHPNGISEENIIHEAVHAATLRVLSMPETDLTPRQLNAKRELEAIYKMLSKNKELTGAYGLTDLSEFVSEVQSNQDFRNEIDTKPWYKRIWHAFLRLFSKAPTEAISQQAERFIKEIYAPSKIIPAQAARPSIFKTQTVPSTIVGNEASTIDELKGNFFGLAGRVQFFDRLGAAEAGIVRAHNANALSDYEAFQTQYFLRMGDMNSQAAGQFITSGPVRIVSDTVAGVKEYRYESNPGANLVKVSDYMEQAAKAGLGTPEEVEVMVTAIIAGDRASALRDGWKRLSVNDPAGARAEYDEYQRRLKANPEAAKFVNLAKAEYKKYNDGLLDFAEQTGFLTPEEVRGLKRTPYVPYYRIESGEVRLFTDNENWIRIGNIKDNPDLQRMVGDSKTILPILTSSVQNTFMLTRMGLQNKATQETAAALYKAGFVSAIGGGMGPANANTVHYKVKGERHFAVIDSDKYGVPADLIVKGMEGIRTSIPSLIRAMGLPANWIRKFVTRSPAYVLRQLVREPVNAAIVGGVDGVPVMNALKQMAKMRSGLSSEAEALQRGLVVNSNVFTGDERDMEMFLRSIATGRGKWAKMMSAFDSVAHQTDAATRATVYADSIKKGMSPARAQFRALEIQNFSRRGLSPSIQWMNMMVPFFNAQLQGLDVLYRAMKGRLPFSERLDIQRKLMQRGLLLTMTAIGYALATQDDEDYKKIPPEVRYGNFLIKPPGATDFIKIPIPYEVGILFKALPEMLIDMAADDTKAKDAVMGLAKLVWQSVPGVVPAAPRPFIEAMYGQTVFGPIESAREKGLDVSERYRESTPEVLRALGGLTEYAGISPLLLEHFVRSYTSALGLSALRVFDPVFRSPTEGEKPTPRESEMPFIGGLFQSTEGRFLIDRAYARMEEVQQAAQTYKDLERRGRKAEAAAYAQDKANLLAAADMAGTFRQSMGEKFADERTVRSLVNMSREQKDALLKRIKESQQKEAKAFFAAVERTTPQ